jgi:formylglycine-generating enzyme required for sulfatase activity
MRQDILSATDAAGHSERSEESIFNRPRIDYATQESFWTRYRKEDSIMPFVSVPRSALLCLSLLSLSLFSIAEPVRAADKTFTNSIGMEFVLIPAGSFMMGSDKKTLGEVDIDYMPQHEVNISNPFYLGKYEVTQEQWIAVMGNNPSWFKGRSNPVEQVSWDDAQVFIRRLNEREGHDRYRLPTEAEWEYACRAGTTGAYSFGDDAGQLEKYAWYGEYSEDSEDSEPSGSTHPVGRKLPNAWGLYDMYGNVDEWVQDWHDKNYYDYSPSTDPTGPASGSDRVLRGGGWTSTEGFRSANRGRGAPYHRYVSSGFRLVLSPESQAGETGAANGMERSGGERNDVEPVDSAVDVEVADKTFINDIGMEFVLIPSGSFTMGADKNFEDASDNETPQHRVRISQSFYLGKYEVTQAQWEAVMGNNPSKFRGRSNPVERVSWNDVQEFIRRLNERAGHARYRLPTEAEWEYAARAGTTDAYSFGDDAYYLGRYAWHDGNSGEETHPVGRKRPNAWGLYDMHGNVWEWVQDWYGERYYSHSPGVDPKGPPSGSYRVERGGGWDYSARFCRAAYRYGITPNSRVGNFGFRLALSPETRAGETGAANGLERAGGKRNAVKPVGGAVVVQAAGKTFTNSIGMEFVLIPAGSFMMGTDENVESVAGNDDEMPQRRVSVSKPFYLGKYEVTQAQWVAVMGNNPSTFKGRSNPVEQVSWEDVQRFIRRLNKREGHARYRLPTEAEWEYAARAGTAGAYSFGDDADSLDRYAWYEDNSGLATHPVGRKLPNAWGLYDMHGNVSEWVQDWYEERYASPSPGTAPKGPSSGSDRVFRGGCMHFAAEYCRSANRNSNPPDMRYDSLGFRLALSPG